MATSRPMTDHVSCGVCMEQYNGIHHIPKILPCQHTFCLACLLSMESNSFSTSIECPMCRSKHAGSPNDFTTNRAIMDAAEEMQQQASASLSCDTHADMESVLICVDCLTGLCVRCMKKLMANPHKDHQLEEPQEAKVLIREKLVSQARKQHDLLKEEMSSASSVKEITRAEDDIKVLCTVQTSAITEWQENQLSTMGKLKAEAARREEEMAARHAELDELLESNSNIKTMLTHLKKSEKISDQSTCPNFRGAHATLLEKLNSVTRSENLVKSKFLHNQLLGTASVATTPRERVQQTTDDQAQAPASSASSCSQGLADGSSLEQQQHATTDIRKQSRREKLQAKVKDDPEWPAYWTKNMRGLPRQWTVSDLLLDVDDTMSAAVENLVKRSCLEMSASQSMAHPNIKIETMQRIENPKIFKDYREVFRRARKVGLNCDFPAITSIDNQPEILTATLNIPELEAIRVPEINEYFLFYFDTKQKAEEVVERGFPWNMFDSHDGRHLSENLIHEEKHADGLQYLIICRVTLGHICHQTDLDGYQHAPCREKGCHSEYCSHNNNRFNSAIATEKDGGKRGFVIFASQFVYPEFLVTYSRM